MTPYVLLFAFLVYLIIGITLSQFGYIMLTPGAAEQNLYQVLTWPAGIFSRYYGIYG